MARGGAACSDAFHSAATLRQKRRVERREMHVRGGFEPGAILAVLLFFAVTSFAGREPEEWDDLPRVDSISFSVTAVGLATPDDRHFVLDRLSNSIQEVPADEFAKRFAGDAGIKAVVEVKRHDEDGLQPTAILRTSSSKVVTTQDAYCDEGVDSKHALWIDGAPVTDHVEPCTSVSSAEIVGANLWLGTRSDGEYGEYPGEGIVVQSLDDGQVVKTLSTEQGLTEGLTGNLIRVIRLDPFGKTVWVATNEGINEVDQNFRIVRTLFFEEKLDPETGRPKLGLSLTRPESRLLPTLFRDLHVSDAKSFYEATRSIPTALQEEFWNELDSRDVSSPEKAFVPEEMNALVPFFIEAARSSDFEARHYALSSLCAFHDQRVVDFLIEQSRLAATAQWPDDPALVRFCLDKFTKLGLLSAEQKDQQTKLMFEQESDALGRIRARTTPGDWDRDGSRDEQIVVGSARGLKQLGDPRGMDLINDYFKVSDGNQRDASLFRCVGMNLDEGDAIAPAMIEGLRKFRGSDAFWGCFYFDMRKDYMRRRFDAAYAEALLVALEQRSSSDAPPLGGRDNCAEAFKAQLADPGVHRSFFDDIYPKLDSQQKALADRLGAEPPHGRNR